jgi:hypothetical protein
VEQVENEHTEKLGNIAFEMDLYIRRIKSLRDMLRPAGPGRVGRRLTTSTPHRIRAGAINAHGSSQVDSNACQL